MSALHQLALTFIKGVGPATAKALLAYFTAPEEIFTTPKGKLIKVPGIGGQRLERLDFGPALERAARELEFVEKNNIDVVFYTDPKYPKRLKNCNDSPVLLYAKGNADLNRQRVISIVGTRNATDYGRQLCKQLLEDLQQYQVLVVSGLALGIDGAAHKESLRLEIPTVGVLGHGLDRMYPSQHRSIADKMLTNGGLITEFPSGTIPDRENFPQRNRIVAGMSDATVVIEAGIKGGALITAEIANSYNRDVFAFPGRINDEFSEGCNFLIRNHKAGLLTCVADLAFLMGWDTKNEARPAKAQMLFPLDLSASEQTIFNAIQQNPTPLAIDELSIKTSMPISQLAMNLLNMEMQGYIRTLPGKTYSVN